MQKNKQCGLQPSFDTIKLPSKIHKIKQEIDAYVIKKDNLLYEVLLGLDAIKNLN